MPTLIKHVRQQHRVEFDKGLFDDWCVYLTRAGKRRYPPKDTEYFTQLQTLGQKHGCGKIYNDFLRFYACTDKVIDPAVLELITAISDTYEADADELDVWFTVIYAGMVAEENKAFTRLGKRIKRLGLHQVLLEGMPPERAAQFSRKPPHYAGAWWRHLDLFMRPKGI